MLLNLPAGSRFFKKHSLFKDWNWDREMQSQILRSIDSLAVLYANANRKKGTARIKPPKQMQPDYVEEAKKEAKKQKREEAKMEQADLAEIFARKNNEVTKEELDA